MNSSPESSEQAARLTAKKAGRRHTLLIPFLIVVVTLMISTAREAAAFHKRKVNVIAQNQQTYDILKKSTKQMEAVQGLQKDLEHLAVTDPVAAKILADFFPIKGPMSQNPAKMWDEHGPKSNDE